MEDANVMKIWFSDIKSKAKVVLFQALIYLRPAFGVNKIIHRAHCASLRLSKHLKGRFEGTKCHVSNTFWSWSNLSTLFGPDVHQAVKIIRARRVHELMAVDFLVWSNVVNISSLSSMLVLLKVKLFFFGKFSSKITKGQHQLVPAFVCQFLC